MLPLVSTVRCTARDWAGMTLTAIGRMAGAALPGAGLAVSAWVRLQPVSASRAGTLSRHRSRTTGALKVHQA